MAVYDKKIAATDVRMPDQIVTEIIKALPAQSVALARARRARMSARKTTQTVLSALPEAFWVNGDTGLKQTAKAAWTGLTMTAEELAVLVPIPNAVFDDTDMPLWDEIKPLLVEALGIKIDSAVLWGLDKPTSWPTAIVPSAVAAGNKVVTTGKLDVDITKLGLAIAEDGYNLDGFVAKAGLMWRLRGLRDTTGQPIFGTGAEGSALYGVPYAEALNGVWGATTPATELIGVDWNAQIIGVRQDVTYDIFDQMVISDDAGKVIFNTAQQDSRVMRVVMRLGWQTANPINRLSPTEATRYPAAVLTAA